jgi:hypothetical protein
LPWPPPLFEAPAPLTVPLPLVPVLAVAPVVVPGITARPVGLVEHAE